jgi:hypothetical protein
MRDLGYSLEAAVADLIDNSISARASHVDIICDLSGDHPCVVIIDDGRGMSPEELVAAMRHGSRHPGTARGPDDLGRFGLGLKTASFSQCRRLTVVSRSGGELSGAEWDLDLIDREDEWILLVLDGAEAARQPFAERIGEKGTAVIWRALDRLFEDERGDRRDEIVNEKLDSLEKHLALVFHRFLSGEIRGHPKLHITVNGLPVSAFDPFCRRNPATQLLPEEVVWVDQAPVHMQPYILPHHSRLTAAEFDFYQSRSDFISNQGAYIYRNGRLMAWGDWFRLIPKGEATKLARVQIDFPNSADESWTIDIKKSRARPPHAVRERLRQIINEITGRSTTVHRGQGARLFTEVAAPLWERYADQSGIRYALNLEHPLIEALEDDLDPASTGKVDLLLEAIAASLPVEMIYYDYATSPRSVTASGLDEAELDGRLAALKDALFGDQPGDALSFREVLKSTRLFERHMAAAEKFIAREFP